MTEPLKPRDTSRGLTADAFSNVLARLGAQTPNLMEGTEYLNTRLTQNYNLMNTLYRSHWIVRKIIDTIPEDMTRNWIKINSQLGPEEVRKIDKIWKRKGVKAKILKGLKWGRLYGGAAALIMIEGHEDYLEYELDYDLVFPGTFKGLMIVDRWSGISPDIETVDDINSNEFGLPRFYRLTVDDGKSFKVHHSRILRFTGRDLPHWEQVAEMMWGASEIEAVFDELKKRDNTSWNIAQLIFLANLRVLKMDQLGQDLAVNNDKAKEDLYNTLQMQNWLMSNMGLYVMDKEDDFATHQYSFSGLNEIYESFMLDVSGASNIPATKLFGRAPAGLNATGESDLENYHETIQQGQESTLAPILDKLLPIICLSELGYIPDDLDYDFNPIQTPNDDEVAELVDKKTTSVINAYQAGLLTQQAGMKELKQMSEATGMFTNITDEDIANADNTLSQGELLPSMGGDLNELMGAQTPDRTAIPFGGTTFDSRPRRFIDWVRRTFRNS